MSTFVKAAFGFDLVPAPSTLVLVRRSALTKGYEEGQSISRHLLRATLRLGTALCDLC